MRNISETYESYVFSAFRSFRQIRQGIKEDGDRGVCWYWVLVPMVPGTGAFGTGF